MYILYVKIVQNKEHEIHSHYYYISLNQALKMFQNDNFYTLKNDC